MSTLQEELLKKRIDILKVAELAKSPNLSQGESALLTRFLHKLADSEGFANVAHTELFNKAKEDSSRIESYIKELVKGRKSGSISVGNFVLDISYNGVNWDLVVGEEVIVANLGEDPLTRCFRDINGFSAIYNSRLSK